MGLALNSKLREDSLFVILDRLPSDSERDRDLRSRPAIGNTPHDLDLAPGEQGPRGGHFGSALRSTSKSPLIVDSSSARATAATTSMSGSAESRPTRPSRTKRRRSCTTTRTVLPIMWPRSLAFEVHRGDLSTLGPTGASVTQLVPSLPFLGPTRSPSVTLQWPITTSW
jgi:hypothetical protein